MVVVHSDKTLAQSAGARNLLCAYTRLYTGITSIGAGTSLPTPPCTTSDAFQMDAHRVTALAAVGKYT